MPKRAKTLSTIEVRRLTKAGLHAVGGVAGLHLQVSRTGARSWILRATMGRHRRDLGLGPYPDVTLAQAREAAREAHALIRQGIDPVNQRQADRQALIASQRKRLTFAEAAKQKHAAIAHEFRNAKHRKQWLSSLEQHTFPVIGDMAVNDVELAHVMAVLEPIWHTKTETANRVRQRMEAVFSWAIVSGYRDAQNPAEWKGNLAEVLPAPAKIKKVRHHRAVPWMDMAPFMMNLRQRRGMAARALELLILTASRSGEVRLAPWEEFHLDEALWIIPRERMKNNRQHAVPLPDDALALLRDLPVLGDYVFPATNGGPLSDMALSALLRRMKVNAVPHGMRSSFKDWARNRSSANDEVSELAIAHVSSDATRAAYARDELVPARRRMMQQWAQFLTEPVGVVPTGC